MHMWFWFGDNLGSFFLSGYNVTTTSGFVCTCLGLTALAILYEGMKILQIKIQQNTTILVQKRIARSSENSSLLSRMSPSVHWYMQGIQVFHWFIHTFLGYILMMAVMTYNVYIVIALVLGGCLGYWIFGPHLIELNMAQFQKKQRMLECNMECADNIVNHQRPRSTVSIVAEQLMTEATVEVHLPEDA